MAKRQRLFRHWRSQFRALVERNRLLGETDFAVCKRLHLPLSRAARHTPPWSANYLIQVFRRSKTVKASTAFKRGVIALANRRGRVRTDHPRIYISVPTVEECDQLKRILPAGEKLNALRVAAHFEDFEE